MPGTKVAAPSLAVTVHEIISLMRIRVESLLTEPAQVRTDDAVGEETLKEKAPPAKFVEGAIFSVTLTAAVYTTGAENEKVNVAPPFVVERVGAPLHRAVPYVGTVKSVLRPIAFPAASFTATTQDTSSPIRTTVVNPPTDPTQDRVVAAVGHDTLKENGLPAMTAEPVTSFSVIRNEAVIAAGAVRKNANVGLMPDEGCNDVAPAPVGP